MVAAALAAGDVASLLVSAGAQQMEMMELLMPLTRARQTALLLDGASAAARKAGADGVHLPADESVYRAARSALGEDAIIGVDCGSSRHLAMAFGEMGADYVGFSGLAPASPGSIIAWWAELFEVPCVALDPADESAAPILVAEGADFIRPPDDMWASADAAARTVDHYNALIGEIFR